MPWKNYPIFQREDNSFIIVVNEAPYHVPNEGEWKELYTEVADFYANNESSRAEYEFQYSDLHPEPPPPEPTPEEQEAALQKYYTDLIQKILDDEAKKLGYDSCLSVCSYVDTGVQKFDDEGKAFRQWRSAVWNKSYEILALVKAGEMEIPTQEELLALLPKLEIIYTS